MGRAICIAVAVLAVACVASARPFTAHHPPNGPDLWTVKLVDKANNNFMFRGDLPLKNDTIFAYDDLVAALRTTEPTLPEKFHLVDIALQWSYVADKHNWIVTEQKFFEDNPDKGEFIHWPLYGDLVNPNLLPMAMRESLGKSLLSWQVDKLPDKVLQLNTMLNTAYDVPRVFYYHCHTGVDRTGEMSISYEISMQKKLFSASLTASDALDEYVNGRKLTFVNSNAAAWFCYYLRFNKIGDASLLDCEAR